MDMFVKGIVDSVSKKKKWAKKGEKENESKERFNYLIKTTLKLDL